MACINNPIPILSLHPVQSLPLLSQPFIIPSIPLPLAYVSGLFSTILRLDAHHLADRPTRPDSPQTTQLNTTRPRNPNCDRFVTATSHDLFLLFPLPTNSEPPIPPSRHARTHAPTDIEKVEARSSKVCSIPASAAVSAVRERVGLCHTNWRNTTDGHYIAE